MGDYLTKLMIVESLLAAIGYAASGDMPRAVYWCGSVLLVGSTLFFK